MHYKVADNVRINKGRGGLAREFWQRIASECPDDDGTEESLTKRRAMLKAAKIYDPR
jgi:hypothetical protein